MLKLTRRKLISTGLVASTTVAIPTARAEPRPTTAQGRIAWHHYSRCVMSIDIDNQPLASVIVRYLPIEQETRILDMGEAVELTLAPRHNAGVLEPWWQVDAVITSLGERFRIDHSPSTPDEINSARMAEYTGYALGRSRRRLSRSSASL